jgi:hypothetical protein
MQLDNATLQTVILTLLSSSRTDARLGRGRYYLAEAVRDYLPPNQQPDTRQIMAAVWSLIGQGLAYIDFTQDSPDNWELCLSDAGLAAVHDSEVNPDNAGEYLSRLQRTVPNVSQVIMQYAREAVVAYTSRCYLASAVMIGGASEAAFLETPNSFGTWLPSGQNQKFLEIINNSRANFITKFIEFRKRIEPLKSQLPDEMSDGMSLTLDSVLDLLRINRNDAGHPTGKIINRDDAFINLQMFIRYLQKLYQLKDYFDLNKGTP